MYQTQHSLESPHIFDTVTIEMVRIGWTRPVKTPWPGGLTWRSRESKFGSSLRIWKAKQRNRIRHLKKCLHNELLFTAMLLLLLITCALQATHTLLHGQTQDRQPDVWSEDVICRAWLPLLPCDYTRWLLSPPWGPWRALVHILKVRIKLRGDYPTMNKSRSETI